MYAAIGKEGQLLYAQEEGPKKGGGPYTCPDCGLALVLKQSHKGRYYFAHKDDKAVRGETLAHRKSLDNLAAWIGAEGLSIQVEPYLSAIDQYPDLLWEGWSRAGVIEVQCSRIPARDLLKRTMAIECQGFPCQWILGQKWATNRLNEMQSLCIRYSKAWDHYLLYALPDGIGVWSHIQIAYPGWRLTYRSQMIPYRKASFKQLAQPIQDFGPIQTDKLLVQKILSSKRQQSFLGALTPQVQILKEAYYLQRQVLGPLAQDWLKQPQGLLCLKDPAWIVQAYIWLFLDRLPKDLAFEPEHLQERLLDLCKRGALRPRPLYQWDRVFGEEIGRLVKRTKSYKFGE